MKGLHPSGFSTAPLTEILRSDARQLIEQAVEAELATLLDAYKHETTEEGRARLVKHVPFPLRQKVITLAVPSEHLTKGWN